MQDGREKFKELSNPDGSNTNRRKSKVSVSGAHVHDEATCDNELERLK